LLELLKGRPITKLQKGRFQESHTLAPRQEPTPTSKTITSYLAQLKRIQETRKQIKNEQEDLLDLITALLKFNCFLALQSQRSAYSKAVLDTLSTQTALLHHRSKPL